MKKLTLGFILALLLISTNLVAHITKDISGAKDNPLISRFNGSFIAYSNSIKGDTYVLPISKIKNMGGAKGWDKKLKLQGNIERIQYVTDKKNSASFIYINYLNALKKSHWEILFSGSDESELGNESYEWQFYMFQEGLGLDDKFGSKYSFRGDKYAYITAKFEDDQSTYYAMIYIINKDDNTVITQDIITVKLPDTGLVTAKLLSDKINKKGHLALDGIFFETAKATLSKKSAQALKNIAQYLNAHKKKKYFIVGHTDNVGHFEANMKLSKNRAQTILHQLISKYGVDPKQIKAYGVANLSPMTSNSTDKGRARNRRVEIVEQ